MRRGLVPSAALAVVLCLAAGCVSVAGKQNQVSPVTNAGTGEFTVAENMLDTWNTIGQILVRTDGVEYESRAQMLGIYAVRYRDQQFLIRSQALVLQRPDSRMMTRVLALGLDGKPDRGVAAVDLLGRLQRRIPAEVGKYRQPIRIGPRQPG
ncbi:hypothetical protein [Cognatiluteimonas profundi]|uniref:hypothetical protein n=1 Tax=Cognatiluteimonas profundi TaxID=2594501 RepID=UPI00131D79D5|nr:hypothetical protein [Lysobacter profundi]